ncbi:DUF6099 family protein [Streptomyces sp. BE303]|uniref:DUF6099 family protein n=1 Tax=Streptomyces sp. BE303 TaxID=3002528 RepID=UPI002E76EA38|nr:DUF6099 family protein [Streptomyces sp. BE303]MED7953236.1 DUF6099 family protein [Streptomyces sp. BE303]
MTVRQGAVRAREGWSDMEALRLIKTARHALAETRNVPDVLAEARQAALLTEAVGARLAESDEGELAGLGQQLVESAAHAAGCLDQSGGDASAVTAFGVGGRAGRLTDLGDLEPALGELGGLLRDVGETLVVLACGADTESLYWTCIDGVDAGAECTDLVGRLLQAVGRATEEDGPPGEDGSTPENHKQEIRVGADRTEEARAEEVCPEEKDVPVLLAPPAGRRGPLLVVRLDPPGAAAKVAVPRGGAAGLPGQRVAVGSPASSVRGPAARLSPVPVGPAPPGAGVRMPEDCSSARSAVTEASSSCICSSRLLGVAGAADPSPAECCGAADASDRKSGMRGPLRIGGAA